MGYMEYLLSNRLYLKHLELEIKGLDDLVDGERWQILTNSLITFNFKFNIRVPLNDQFLDSFRTLFWLEEKQWFVAYEDQHLFSVPHFSPKQIQSSYQSSALSTAPNDSFLYANFSKLIVNNNQIPNKYFGRIDTLDLESTILQKGLLNTINVCYITYLSVLSLDDIIQFTPFERIIPNVCQLSVKNEITFNNVQRMINKSYRQICKLEIKVCRADEVKTIEELFRLFPYTKHLTYKSDIYSIERMASFIDGFTHLLNASFTSFSAPNYYDENSYMNPDLMILKTNRIIYGTTMCRIYCIFTLALVFSVNWWIEE